ncbi:monocarboxylate transporter 14-like [Actinia tenebrosa]|uniref:Monocarboxylate transporter 14-like n=1 Tax=Actinia tenebrosa TaxID=6105 RepID=A0A6P8HI57_ACTTE|nr:monocarboxylate transporter 14-like [Actinia tenebrosa]
MNNSKDTGWSWLICVGSFICNLVIGAQMNCSGVFMSAFVDNYKVSRGEAAWVAVLASSAVYFFAPLSTSLCNRIGSRMTVAMGTIICMVAMVSSSFHSSFKALYFTFGILWGLGASLSYYPNFVMLSKYFEKKISLANGISTSGSSIGTIALSPLIQYAFKQFGLSNGFRILACFHILLIIPVCLYRPPEADKTAKISRTSKTSRTSCIDKDVLKNSKYRIWVVAVIFFQPNQAAPFAHVVRLGQDIGASKITASLLISIMAGASLVGRLAIGRVADLKCLRQKRKNIMQIAFLCIAVSTALAPFSPSFIWLALYAAVFGLNEGIYMNLFMVITKDIVGADHLAFAFGILCSILSVPKTVGPLFAGFMFDSYQSYVLPFMVIGDLTALAAILLFRIRSQTSMELSVDDEPETENIVG